jgi:hypothetical protein
VISYHQEACDFLCLFLTNYLPDNGAEHRASVLIPPGYLHRGNESISEVQSGVIVYGWTSSVISKNMADWHECSLSKISNIWTIVSYTRTLKQILFEEMRRIRLLYGKS